jgi:hypothetical protein
MTITTLSTCQNLEVNVVYQWRLSVGEQRN